MDLFFGKIVFHRRGEKEVFGEVEQNNMLEDLTAVLNKHGVELARYEFAGLLGKYHRTDKCHRCGNLTLDVSNSSGELEKGDVFDDLNEIIHLGHIENENLICLDCKEWI
ncbi:hypothetical protein NBRC116583_39140 [Arenicella sp. 4NH20-0111]|uniref:hypothetical protein n=1 Tax=Arenicella sp. 4NH20-0111 TaxID=3127648 RepID=UPI0031027E70